MPYAKSGEHTMDGEEKISGEKKGNVEKEKQTDVQDVTNRQISTFECSLESRAYCSETDPPFKTTGAAENELINFDDASCSDEEDTWLYTSPKDLTKEEKAMSPYKWLRKDVEDPSNRQLQMAKTALVSKLDELVILGCTQNSKLSSKGQPVFPKETKTNHNLLTDCIFDQSTEYDENAMKDTAVGIASVKYEQKAVLDQNNSEKNKLTAVFEKARLQEESLKLSSSKFFDDAARTFPRGKRSTSSAGIPSSNLTKPASVEALCASYGKQNSNASSPMNIAQKKLLQSSPHQSPFGSTTSLHFPRDLHRSSLPNLNKGYNSLRSKKRTSESRIQCPLPIYPRGEIETIKTEGTSISKARNTVLIPATYGESQTLPSSYRSKSRNSSMNKREPYISSVRRDSSPSPLCQRNTFMVNPSRRESLPCVSQQSPRKKVGQLNLHGRSMSVLSNSRTVSMNQLSPETFIEQNKSDIVIQSFSKRQPLSSVHNYSPQPEDYPMIHNNEDLRRSSFSSKIPSPSIRSAIPVPSAKHIVDKSSPTEKNWSEDFY